ncbi:MAG TPA: VIT domain-containing protein [Micromonosporaceae bacterium]
MTIRVLPMRDDEATNLASPDERAGLGTLATRQGNLPLQEVDVAVQITGLAVRTRLTQVFGNPYDVPLEATYIFPLPDRAGVTGIRMEAADRVVEGVLKERQQARDEYDRAVAAGQRAAIAEEERPDVFTMRVGNIAPGERVTVRLTLAGEVPYEDGAATYRFPLVVAPRYIPGSRIDGPVGDGVAPDTDAVPDASRITPPVLLPGFPNPVRLTIAVDLDPAGLAVRDIRSSLHQVTVTQSDGVARIELGAGERLDRDFVLRWQPEGIDTAVTPSLAVVPDTDASGAGTFQLTLIPPTLSELTRPRDVAVVLDRSGSMAGWKMVAARRAAARIVDSLGSADRFAVLGFDTVVERPALLGDGLVAAGDRHRFRAVEFLARLEARGGTEILHPLREALALLGTSQPDRDRVLVLVTDGQVGNEDQILRELATELASVRVHAVGIDQAVNVGFLGRLAVAGGGRCELVESEDRLDEAMDRIHRRISTAVVTGLRVETDGRFDIDQVSPGRLPDLFVGTPSRIHGRYLGTPTAMTVTGWRPDGTPWRVTVPAAHVDNPALAAVWARARLRDLEDRYAATSAPETRESLERDIVATSLRFGVLCRFTAFVAVDSRVAHHAGEPHRVVQPVEVPVGWQMLAAPSPQPVPASPAMWRTASTGFSPAMITAAGPARIRRPTTDEAPGLTADVATVLATELRRLNDLAGASPAQRWMALADLASRLRALARQVAGPGRDALVRLAESLSVCDGPLPQDPEVLERLWRRTVTELQEFPRASGQSRPTSRRGGFWKRA